MKYTCPACGYLVFSEQPGSHDICPICFWEDDLSQLRFVSTTGANRVSLVEAQENYVQFGAVERGFVSHVRKPDLGDQRDSEWRSFDSKIDKMEVSEPDKDYGLSYPSDRTKLYYWKNS